MKESAYEKAKSLFFLLNNQHTSKFKERKKYVSGGWLEPRTMFAKENHVNTLSLICSMAKLAFEEN